MVDIWRIFVVFEDFSAVLVVSDLGIARIGSPYERLQVVCDGHVMLGKRCLESLGTEVSTPQTPYGVAQFLLLLGGEPVVSPQVHVWRAQTSERSGLVVYRGVLVLLGINVHVTLFDLTLGLIGSLLGQSLDEALGANLLGPDLSAFVDGVTLFFFLPSLVADRRSGCLV